MYNTDTKQCTKELVYFIEELSDSALMDHSTLSAAVYYT